MSRRVGQLILVTMFAAAAWVRVHNALTYPALRGYDGFGHFIYVWFLAETGRVPLATTGWSFFHPPFYYALVAAIWKGLDGVDAVERLNVAAVAMSLLSLTHAWTSYLIVRRWFPNDRVIQLLAPGLMLFVPVHIYSAPFLGNEGLNAVLCSISIYALLRVLETRSILWTLTLGIGLGLAMLTKFSSLAVVAGALGTLALRTVLRREWRRDGTLLVVAGSVMVLVCGWYYVRNVLTYGTPFKLSRDEFMVQHVEHIQTKGERGLGEYLLFDPVILMRPMWPRGLPLAGEIPPTLERSTLREAVWTGMFANTWFDGFGGWILPFVTESELARRLGQILLTLGVIPTTVVLAGLLSALSNVARKGWDDTRIAMLLTFWAMVAIFIQGTRTAPLHAAIKATYFMPITLIFSYWFALGLDVVRRRLPWCRPAVVSACAALAFIGTCTFWHGFLFPARDFRDNTPGNAAWKNMYGIVYYAADDRASAKALFEEAAQVSYHLALENLATLAFEDGQTLEALYLQKRAARYQPRQSFGTVDDRRRYDRTTQAEYLNSMAVMYYDLGWLDDARRAATQAVTNDALSPEALYDLAIIEVTLALELPPQHHLLRRTLLDGAENRIQRLRFLDPAFWEGEALRGTIAAVRDDCAGADEARARAAEIHATMRRQYPAETGPGIPHSAAIDRRRYIEEVAQSIVAHQSRCEATSSPAAISAQPQT